ncbi:hypothetical protein D3C83_32990 [compost metagenome]
MDRLRGGADEHLVELVFAVLGIVGDFDLRRVLGEGPQGPECLFQLRVKIAADFAGPADVDRALAGIELDARLLALDAVSFRDRLDVEVFEPLAQRVLDL